MLVLTFVDADLEDTEAILRAFEVLVGRPATPGEVAELQAEDQEG